MKGPSWYHLIVIFACMQGITVRPADAQFVTPVRHVDRSLDSDSPAYFAILGEVVQPGCYALATRTPRLSELVEEARGLTSRATPQLRIIRDGRDSGLRTWFYDGSQFTLLPGDVIVVDAKPHHSGFVSSQSAATDSKPTPVQAGSLQIACINLLDYPVVLKLSAEMATLPLLMNHLGQTNDVMTSLQLIGHPAVRRSFAAANSAMPLLASGMVLVFDADLVDRDRLPKLPSPVRPGSSEATENASDSVPRPLTESKIQPPPMAISELSTPSDIGVARLPSSQTPSVELLAPPREKQEISGFAFATDQNRSMPPASRPSPPTSLPHLTAPSGPASSDIADTPDVKTPEPPANASSRSVPHHSSAVAPLSRQQAEFRTPQQVVKTLPNVKSSIDRHQPATDPPKTRRVTTPLDRAKSTRNAQSGDLALWGVYLAGPLGFVVALTLLWSMLCHESKAAAPSPKKNDRTSLNALINNDLPLAEEPLDFPNQREFHGHRQRHVQWRIDDHHEPPKPQMLTRQAVVPDAEKAIDMPQSDARQSAVAEPAEPKPQIKRATARRHQPPAPHFKIEPAAVSTTAGTTKSATPRPDAPTSAASGQCATIDANQSMRKSSAAESTDLLGRILSTVQEELSR